MFGVVGTILGIVNLLWGPGILSRRGRVRFQGINATVRRGYRKSHQSTDASLEVVVTIDVSFELLKERGEKPTHVRGTFCELEDKTWRALQTVCTPPRDGEHIAGMISEPDRVRKGRRVYAWKEGVDLEIGRPHRVSFSIPLVLLRSEPDERKETAAVRQVSERIPHFRVGWIRGDNKHFTSPKARLS